MEIWLPGRGLEWKGKPMKILKGIWKMTEATIEYFIWFKWGLSARAG
jgi:hypothetical protein